MFRIKLLTLLVLLIAGVSRAQTTISMMDSIYKHIAWYRIKKPNTLLFIHLDKTVYVNNDMMWFSGYLLGVPVKDMSRHTVLAAALINDNDQAIAAQGKFVMNSGLAGGNLMIPDSVPPGHYSFIAYTNCLANGKPEAFFVQSITLKTAAQPPFDVELVLDTLYKDPVNVRVLLKADVRNKPLDGAAINYYLGKDQRTRLTGKAKTNVIGSYTMLLPKNHITPAQHNLEVQVKSGTDVKTLHLDIPIKKQAADVKFYPEGGYLTAGLPNRVGWEVKLPGGTAIKTAAILYAGKESIDTIETDSFGMGAFNIIPVRNVNYTVKLSGVDGTEENYALPGAMDNTVVMHLNDALANDSLLLRLQSNNPAKITLLIHDYRQVYAASQLNLGRQGLLVKLNVADIPRGLHSITILDSLQRPIAERLFFAHYNQKPALNITVADQGPGTRQKVNIKLKINSINGMRIKGIVSVACVQDNRFEIKNDNNIEHYVYLQSELDNLPLKDTLMGNNTIDRKYLNELLLVRGWSKYKWPELMHTGPADTIKLKDSLVFKGTVTHFTSQPKKPLPLIMMKDSSGINLFNSDDKGCFTMTNKFVYTPPDKKVRLIVSGQSDEYLIKVTDPYPEVNMMLAKNIEPVAFEQPVVQNTKEFVLTGFEHATHLKEVKIKASNNNFLHAFSGANANACGDYVCKFHILNCPNHRNDPDNRPPLQGEIVAVPGQGRVAYNGCATGVQQEGMMAFTGVYMAREFYGADYAQINPPDPDYLSTICWKHDVRVNSYSETELSFYTSDITGKFRIVVQGITNQDVVYGEDSFTVQKKVP